MKLIKLHIGLFRYIKMELKKKRTSKQLVKFYKELVIAYIKEIIKLYTELFLIFDKNYRETKVKFEHQQQIKKDLNRALKMLRYIDQKMIKIGKNRQERRAFWRDFYKNAQVRNEVFTDLERELK